MDGSKPETRKAFDVGELLGAAETDLGLTEWRTMEQERVDEFANVTEDHNPIHIDSAFAAGTPFGGTIAHGYLTLSMLAPLLEELLRVDGASMSINYGLDKLRFPGPLLVGSRYRAGARLGEVEEVGGGGVQIRVAATIEVEAASKPALVAECLFRYYA